jgi:hypothetical protein
MTEEHGIPEKIRVCECCALCDLEGEQCLGYPAPSADDDIAAGRRTYNDRLASSDRCRDDTRRSHRRRLRPPPWKLRFR